MTRSRPDRRPTSHLVAVVPISRPVVEQEAPKRGVPSRTTAQSPPHAWQPHPPKEPYDRQNHL